jgi:hypothetical protein
MRKTDKEDADDDNGNQRREKTTKVRGKRNGAKEGTPEEFTTAAADPI